MDAEKKLELQKFALEVKLGALTAIKSRGFGHIGGSLSAADTIAVLYKAIMNYDPQNPDKPDRDKLVCSKGHAGPAVYGALALCGFFPMEVLKTLNQPHTKLPSHCDKHLAGIDATTGSLGQGTSQAVGIALADKLQGRSSRTFLIVGDGELNEGQCWEAAMFSAGKGLTNLTWIVDWNKKQLDGTLDEILPQFDLAEKFKSFGFDVVVVKGDDVEGLYEALSYDAAAGADTDDTADDGETRISGANAKPRAIILDSIKGCGVKEVEETEFNHSMAVEPEVFDRWIADVQAQLDAISAA